MKLFNNPKKTVIAILVFVALFVASLATRCHAGETRFSVGAAALRGPTGVIQIEYLWGERGDSHLETGVTLVGTSVYRGDQPNNFMLNTTLVDGFGPVDIGLGLAFVQNTDVYNSANANFHLLVGYHYRKLFLTYNHFSNAGTKQPNLGRDLVLVGWRF